MKLKNLFIAAVAVLGLAAACQKAEENIPAGITVDTPKIEADANGTTKQVKVTSSEAWSAIVPEAAKDWLHVTPVAGNKGETTITVTVDPLSGKPRNSKINFLAGLFNASISVVQSGTEVANDGKTPATAFTASEAYAWVMENISTDSEASAEQYYVKGYIHKIGVYNEVEQYFTGNSYGNATFYISDGKEYDPNTEKDFEAYQVNYLGNRKFVQGKDTDIKIGDEVIIFGHLTKYKTTAETMQQNSGKGAYIYSLNGKVEESTPQTEITASTVADFIKNADPNTYYRLTGKVSAFKTGTNNSGKNYMQFNLTDETGTILVYGFKDGQYDEWASKLSDGGTVVLTGTYEYYSAKEQHEVMQATIESFEAGQQQTEITDATVAEFIQSDGVTYYRLTGKVSGFYTGKSGDRNYMGFDLTDATGTITVYGFKDGEYDKWADKIKDFGTVVLTGTYEYYAKNDKHEVMNTTIESFTEGEAPTEFETLSIADFIAKADAVNQYRLKGTVTEFNIDNPEKKYMKITMKDATGEILVYSFKDGEFDKWSGQITEGGAISVVGSYKDYQGTPEVVNATIESFEADANYKYCKVDGSKEIKVAASATEAEVKIKANTAWTITTTQGEAVATPASGSADATVKVTFAANTSTESDVVYTLKLAATEASVEETITITQGKASAGDELNDVLDRAFTGVEGTQYKDWSGKAGSESSAVYAGQTAGGNDAIQMRSNNNNSGIISTTSGGTLKKVAIEWNENTAATRTLQVYGSNTAYSSPTDLYGDNKGTLLGEINIDNATELEIDGSYQYIGLRSKSGAMYLDKITITWE